MCENVYIKQLTKNKLCGFELCGPVSKKTDRDLCKHSTLVRLLTCAANAIQYLTEATGTQESFDEIPSECNSVLQETVDIC